MTTRKTIADAIARSISHDEIAYVDVGDLLRDEAIAAGDTGTVVQQIIAAQDGVEDDVENGDVHEMWGTTDDGDEWRVHIRMTR